MVTLASTFAKGRSDQLIIHRLSRMVSVLLSNLHTNTRLIRILDNFYGELKDARGDRFVPLAEGIDDPDFVCLTQEAWDLVIQWYGLAEASHIVVRYACNTATESIKKQNIQYEYHPVIITLQKLRDTSAEPSMDALRERNLPAPCIVASRTEPYQDFLKRAKTSANIDMKTKVKVWKVLEVQEAKLADSGILTPANSRGHSPVLPADLGRTQAKLLLDLYAFTKLVEGSHRELINFKDETANEKYNGKSNKVDNAGFESVQTIILEEQVNDSDDFVSDKLKKASAQHGVDLESSQELSAQPLTRAKAEAKTIGQSAPSGQLTKQKNKKGRPRGCTGLTNLGNTCYMNSALQCIRSVEELAIYMLEGKYKTEINTDNPLGYNGQIAKAYGDLVSALYAQNSGSYGPRPFKNTLGRCQPLFSGYGQQDSQEFLSFLVDGLHEDLNRIVKKPYRENPDSDDNRVHDPEYIKELGQIYRDNHHARNDSVAMDLFSGFYKNTMVCPACDKVSVTFDPYSLVTLQLPVENTFQHVWTFAPLIGKPVKVKIDVDKNSNLRMLKDYFVKRFPNTQAANLMIVETYNRKIYKVFDDAEIVAEANIRPDDKIWVFELDHTPTNVGIAKSKTGFRLGTKSSSNDLANTTRSEYMAIPLFHRCSEVHKSDFLLQPWIIMISREEARDLDHIKRKVLRAIQSMTTSDLFGDNRETLDEEKSDDTVLMSQDDKDDDRVQARSVESEESLVNVAMTNEIANPAPETSSQPVTHKTGASRVLDPDYFVDPMLTNSFTLSILPGANDEPFPTGWNNLSVTTRLHNIESRMQQSASRRESRQSNSSYGSRNKDTLAPESDDELSRDDVRNGLSPSPSDTEDAPVTRSLGRRDRFRTAFHDAKRSLSKTFKKADRRGSSAGPQQELLIRPGEGLVLDWHDQPWRSLFGGDDKNELRGQPSFTDRNIKEFEDPEFNARVARRNSRKRSGVTLQECFDETSKSEVLSEENAWYCGRCKELRRATKTLEIWTAPDILVVHLKRFSSTSRMRDKIDVLVDAPVEGLDLAGKVGLPEDKSLIYDLFAVDNHYGGLGGGHYTAYAQNFFDKEWYEYNDSSVSSTSPSGVVTKAAYLLFYRRRAPKYLGPPYLADLVDNAWEAHASTDSSSSLSGEDQRPDDSSSPNGSSTSSLEVGPPRRSANAAIRRSQSPNSNVPRRGFGFNGGSERATGRTAVPDYDEAIGMGGEGDGVMVSREFDNPSWGFGGIPNGNGSDADMEDDHDVTAMSDSSQQRRRQSLMDSPDSGTFGIDADDDGADRYQDVEHVGLKGGHGGMDDDEEEVERPVHEIKID